ncbi:hypothetical protein LC574_11690 [Nostoc sp. CHAB 5715]|nr:hypothetical protein [Nostoc sp. CHAB 5715]
MLIKQGFEKDSKSACYFSLFRDIKKSYLHKPNLSGQSLYKLFSKYKNKWFGDILVKKNGIIWHSVPLR